MLITKGALQESSTRYAQGGIAVAMSEDDEIGFHVEDTLKAGAGLCNETAVKIMVEEGIERVSELIEWGANFDKEGENLGFTQEAAHQRRRIVQPRRRYWRRNYAGFSQASQKARADTSY